MKGFFGFEHHGIGYHQEILTGLKSFLIMAYIIINPAILRVSGIHRGPCTVATILAAAFGTVLMGLCAGSPFAVPPYMEENAFIVFTVVKIMGYPWPIALGAVFIADVLFTLLKARGWLAEARPLTLKFSFSVGNGGSLSIPCMAS